MSVLCFIQTLNVFSYLLAFAGRMACPSTWLKLVVMAYFSKKERVNNDIYRPRNYLNTKIISYHNQEYGG